MSSLLTFPLNSKPMEKPTHHSPMRNLRLMATSNRGVITCLLWLFKEKCISVNKTSFSLTLFINNGHKTLSNHLFSSAYKFKKVNFKNINKQTTTFLSFKKFMDSKKNKFQRIAKWLQYVFHQYLQTKIHFSQKFTFLAYFLDCITVNQTHGKFTDL
jgi:uncharacterized membrane protein YjdF